MKPIASLHLSAPVCAVLFGVPLPSHAQVPSNALLRTLEIKTPAELGTAFTIDVDHRQYIITAKHIITPVENGGKTQHRHQAQKWVVTT
jgi:hypothetical protein